MTSGGEAPLPGPDGSPGIGTADLPLHVVERGHGLPILLLHGYGASTHSFRHWVPELARDHRVMPLDLKGFGAAPKPDDGRYSPVDLAEPVVELIRRMDLRSVTLVGHSLGGGIALVAALLLLDRGELGRLRGLVSVSGAAYAQALPPFARLARWPRASRVGLALVPKAWMVRRVLESVVHDPGAVDPDQVEGYAEPLRNPATHGPLLAAARQIVPPGLPALTARYPELDVPALLLWGREDRVVPLAVGERLEKDLPRARLVVLERCGHLPAEERPREALRVLREFLAETAPTPDPAGLG